ncbi:MAG TPA: YehR family protein [Candidatus Dormibacteraeota bacterium]|nr:YehR family protein [Candidatus Dormibacteraeota bacterium]
MKKWIMFCLTLLISITLAACGSTDNNNDNENVNNTDNTNVEEETDTNLEENEEPDTDSEINEEPETDTEGNENINTNGADDAAAADFDFDPNGENIVVLQLEQNGVNMKLTYKAEGDKVIEQTSDNVIPYEAIGATNAEEAEETLAELVESYQSIEGITHNIEYQDDQAIESVTTNYEEIDMEAASELDGAVFEGDISQGISLQQSVNMLVQQGFEIVE